MTSKEWAGACGISHATYAMRRRLVAAEVRSCQDRDGHRRILLPHLQLDNWHDCHSLFLDMRQLGEDVAITPAEVDRISAPCKQQHVKVTLRTLDRPASQGHGLRQHACEPPCQACRSAHIASGPSGSAHAPAAVLGFAQPATLGAHGHMFAFWWTFYQ